MKIGIHICLRIFQYIFITMLLLVYKLTLARATRGIHTAACVTCRVVILVNTTGLIQNFTLSLTSVECITHGADNIKSISFSLAIRIFKNIIGNLYNTSCYIKQTSSIQ